MRLIDADLLIRRMKDRADRQFYKGTYSFYDFIDIVNRQETIEITPCYLGSPCEYQNEDISITNGWISVSERLPEEDGRYFVIRLDYVTDTRFDDVLWYEDGEWWNRHYRGDYSVIAWMPIPQYEEV